MLLGNWQQYGNEDYARQTLMGLEPDPGLDGTFNLGRSLQGKHDTGLIPRLRDQARIFQ
ncbi:MAG: hypothetical protein HOO98_20260 [Nitrospira sp.]|nr:hypothetical protein [Nitrospira sp.]